MNGGWRSHVKYPHCEGHGSWKGVMLMDTLDELIPFNQFVDEARDRLDMYLKWIRAASDAGLIDYSDEIEIRGELVRGCGGL